MGLSEDIGHTFIVKVLHLLCQEYTIVLGIGLVLEVKVNLADLFDFLKHEFLRPYF